LGAGRWFKKNTLNQGQEKWTVKTIFKGSGNKFKVGPNKKRKDLSNTKRGKEGKRKRKGIGWPNESPKREKMSEAGRGPGGNTPPGKNFGVITRTGENTTHPSTGEWWGKRSRHGTASRENTG